MNESSEEMILATIARKGCTHLTIDHGPAKREQTSCQPKQNNGVSVIDAGQLKTQTGKDTGANHIRHHQGGGSEQTDMRMRPQKILLLLDKACA
jgi:hypothetical protein